jgi:hypothetical protein
MPGKLERKGFAGLGFAVLSGDGDGVAVPVEPEP